ncbi:MAG TPA: hypothetical protein VKB35_09795 [Ktedonobacteraceae bacterium]|nr:hypothetical protein [Ktedonobacteraceae bacterium]
MPRDNPKPRSDLDVEARLPTGIKFVLAFVILLFIAGAAGLIYLNISNQAATTQANATATAQAHITGTAHAATATAKVTATALAHAHAGATATAIVLANTNATATARALASFLVQSITISVSPASIAGMACGTPVNVTYTATITIAPGSPGGTVKLTWNIGSTSTPASVTFAPSETVKTVAITDMGTLARDNSYPRNGSITSTSPNVVSSTTTRPAGTCV